MARRVSKEDNRINVSRERVSDSHRNQEKEVNNRAPQQRPRSEMMRDEIIRIRQYNDLYERQSI
jgi:hypothetical protein